MVTKAGLTVEEKVPICGRKYFYVQWLIFLVSIVLSWRCFNVWYDVLDVGMTSVTGYHISVNIQIYHVEFIFWFFSVYFVLTDLCCQILYLLGSIKWLLICLLFILEGARNIYTWCLFWSLLSILWWYQMF